MSMKICYWGSGPISTLHIPAIRAAGMEVSACFSREESSNLRDFAKRFDIVSIKTEEDFLIECEKTRVVFVALKTEVTADALWKLNNRVDFVFFEKPGAFEVTNLQGLVFSKTQFFGLYNRRFYNTIEAVKQRIKIAESPLNINFNFPDTKKGWHQFYINGCHMIDLTMHILDDFDLKLVNAISSGEDSGFSFLAKSKKGHSIAFSNPWGASETASLLIYTGSVTLKLQPIEKLTISKSMTVNEPTLQSPIRTYTPEIFETIFVQTDFKPGFLEQALEAKEISFLGGKKNKLATLKECLSVLTFIASVQESLS